ncbi:MAG: SGNH/GDSL hydrolase family protein [Prevotella sp.]|nr:SGNH/GDSL hydrolase family protein [Prevotella sp.]MCI2081536.1 SGNH/GDSL hydrolase family protein [Prevotella sp.]MCI2103400.1 SGNH/GDSL hydrolase family protein [Prevotella sp.]
MKKLIFLFTFILCASTLKAQLKWYSPLGGDTAYISGRGWNQEMKDNYHRLPNQFKDQVRPALWNLSNNSAGLYISFFTNAPQLIVKYTVNEDKSLNNVAYLAKSGIDLYCSDKNGKVSWCACPLQFNFGKTTADTITFPYRRLPVNASQGFEYRLYLPLYNTVTSMKIGVPVGSTFFFEPLPQEKPIVVYGTSIGQGASASRPGLCWTNLLQRRLDMPVYNLAFSGNGRLEDAMFKILSQIDAKMYIIDCLPNIDEPDSIMPRILRGMKILRSKNNAPILFTEHDGYSFLGDGSYLHKVEALNRQLKETFQRLKASGYQQIYYLSQDEIGMMQDMDTQVDGLHANDIGMRYYADAYQKKIEEIIDYHPLSQFLPVRQFRDYPSYMGYLRHVEVLERNHRVNPDVVMIGNSITHYWSGEPKHATLHRGDKSWKKLFGKRTVTNLGFGWDRIENIAWRFYHGELDGITPQHIFLMAGTNNIGLNSNEEIANGVVWLVGRIRQLQPQAHIHVVKIYPRANGEERVKAINDLIEKKLKTDSRTDLVDCTSVLSDKNGKIDRSCFTEDGLHPNGTGYERIAKVYKRYLNE